MKRLRAFTLNAFALPALTAFGLASASVTVTAAPAQDAAIAHTPGTVIEAMPADLETRYALSALPGRLRDEASVYLLDPDSGYRLAREGSSGVACLVERTAWELSDFRDDIYIPLCYDAAGIGAHFKVILDTAAMRAQGMSPEALKAEVERRYRDKVYRAPAKAGLSYMIAPVMRTIGPPDLQVRTMSMPHFMFYAPGLTNADLGARPDLAEPASLMSPFIDRQGNDEQSYMIQMVGAAEKAAILAEEKPLLDDLCAYRDVLCASQVAH
ncbi:hypothetical protein [Marilutibacter maris]|uniref:hypothetical protein n=1 Tax=Marilutibacter maris TaxID=1605891 RepID=UPI001478E806|nr:hypothetical protein [Lysobacter maris]